MTIGRRRRLGPAVPLGAALEAPAEPYPAGDAVLDDLLRRMSEARRGLELDLSLAAGAVAEGRDDLAVELVEDGRDRVEDFGSALMTRILELEWAHARAADAAVDAAVAVAAPAPPAPSSTWRRVVAPVAPVLAAAAAVATMLSGGLSQTVRTPSPVPASQQALLQSSYDDLAETVLRRGDAAAVLAAARQLNRAVAPLVSVAAHDPIAAATARSVLIRQRNLLRGEQPSGSSEALSETDDLLRELGRVGIALPPLPGLGLPLPSGTAVTGGSPAAAATAGSVAARPVASPLPTAPTSPSRLVLPLPPLPPLATPARPGAASPSSTTTPAPLLPGAAVSPVASPVPSPEADGRPAPGRGGPDAGRARPPGLTPGTAAGLL